MAIPPDTKTGYLYALEVTGHGVQGHVFILLGQTKDINSTMKRWNKIHSSHKAFLKTLWPLKSLNDHSTAASASSGTTTTTTGNIRDVDAATALKRYLKTHPQEKIRCYERVTKLVETELSQYRRREPCVDCKKKTVHPRLFVFPDNAGSSPSWEDIVGPIVDKWRSFYAKYQL